MGKNYSVVSRYLLHTMISLVTIWYIYNLRDLKVHNYRYSSFNTLLVVLAIVLIVLTTITIITPVYKELFFLAKFSFSVFISFFMFIQVFSSAEHGLYIFDPLLGSAWNYLLSLLIVIFSFISIYMESILKKSAIQLSYSVVLIRGAILIVFPIIATLFSYYIFVEYLGRWFFE